MIARLAAVTLTLALVGGLATGCQPEPDPSPSGPVFATEEEAFAAAEETYRAYVDALNQVDLSDPETFEAVYVWTTGELNASDRKGLTGYHADGVTVSGSSKVALLVVENVDLQMNTISLAVCLDVSEVKVVSQSGASLVDPDRTDIQSLVIDLEKDDASTTHLLLNSIGPREGDPQCAQ